MSNSNDSENIEILIDQVGRMSEGITALRMSVDALRGTVETGFDELKAVSERQEQNIARQERNIDRLVGVVELLIERDRQHRPEST